MFKKFKISNYELNNWTSKLRFKIEELRRWNFHSEDAPTQHRMEMLGKCPQLYQRKLIKMRLNLFALENDSKARLRSKRDYYVHATDF